MIPIPPFDSLAIVGDKPPLVAEICSLFTRCGRYLAVLDGPRMTRPDWSNEVIRRNNALAKTQCCRILLADLDAKSVEHLSHNSPAGKFVSVNSAGEATAALKGWIKAPSVKMNWGSNNLGVGLLIARRSKQSLKINSSDSPTTSFVSGGTHLLIACESADELAQIVASNLAFATDASFMVIPQLSEQERDEWLEEMYSLGSEGDVSARFVAIRDFARGRLPKMEFEKYKQICFITNGFPWGITVPECATTHMFSYPDFGRCVVEGIWASQDTSRGARNALLIHPGRVEGSEIEVVGKSLYANKTLVRIHAGPQATVSSIHLLIETFPFDIIVISTHCGDVCGQRVTYEFNDSEGLSRRLVVDHAIGFGYDPATDKVLVQQFQRFHELDGVDWTDRIAKANLYVGTAIETWVAFGGNPSERDRYKIASEKIHRVIGSMALQMHDDLWFPLVQAFSPSCSPAIVNNGCSSWHELSKRFAFAGARAYVGALFPVLEAEAQEVCISIFRMQLGTILPSALWNSQNAVYGSQGRRPYAMVGLPFCFIPLNTVDSYGYVIREYKKAIAEFERKAEESAFSEIKDNCLRYTKFLIDDHAAFIRTAPKIIDT